MSEPALALLESQALQFGASISTRTATRLEIGVPVPLPDGQAPYYSITAEAKGRIVSAKETFPTRLPASCPERHINSDGTFCVGWVVVTKLDVDNETDAWNWWARLIKFLRLQVRAARLRRWPDLRGWGHGDSAIHQRRAERAANRLGQSFADAVARNRLEIHRGGNVADNPIIIVKRDRARIFAIWEKAERPVNLRRRCICEGPARSRSLALRDCADHADAAVELALALRDREREEARFWKSYEGSPCCGTMDHCPLAI